MPEIKDGANHKDIIVPDAEVEELFTNIGIGFGCEVIYINKNEPALPQPSRAFSRAMTCRIENL